MEFGLVLLAEANLVFAVCSGPYSFLLGVCLFGLHLGATQSIFSTLISEVAEPQLRATAFGVFNFFSGLAMLLSGLVAGGLWEFFGAQFCFVGGIVFAAATFVCLRIKQTDKN